MPDLNHVDHQSPSRTASLTPELTSALTAMVEAMPVLAAVLDDRGELLLANRAWQTSLIAQRVQQVAAGRVPNVDILCEAISSSVPQRSETEAALHKLLDGPTPPFSRIHVLEERKEERSFQLRASRLEGLAGAKLLLTHEDVTLRVRSERALRESDRLLRTVLRALPVGVSVADDQGRVVMSNPAGRAILGGHRIASALGEPSVVMIEEETGREVPPNEWPIRRAIETGVAVNDLVLRVEQPGVRPRIVSFSALPLTGAGALGRGAVGVQLDITERTKAERAVRRNERQQRALLGAVLDGIIGFDREGRAAFANPAAEAILARPMTQILGSTLAQLFGDAAATELLANRGGTIEQSLQLANGASSICEMSLSQPADDREQSVEGVLSVRDITQRRKMQTQIAQSQKLEAIGQLAAGIAHEINTPTQFIGDNVRFLDDSFKDIRQLLDAAHAAVTAAAANPGNEAWAEVKRLIETIDFRYLADECPLAISQSIDGVERVAKIVSSMKEFAHPDSKSKQAVDLNRVATSATTVCRNEWKYVAELALDLQPELPSVAGFTGDLGQVTLNLVVNAAQAIGEHLAKQNNGDGSARGNIRVRTRSVDGGVELSVSDDGPGIPEAYKSRIFEQFFTTKPVGKGTGQGLSLVHRIVTEKHGGRVWFESEEGKGTTFFVWLPS